MDHDLSKIADECLAVLTNFPSDGQLRDLDQNTLMALTVAGFIERKEIQKSCKTCGTPRFDYAYFRITGGGRLFMEMAQRVSA